MLKESFQYVIDNYVTEDTRVSNASHLYDVLVHEIPMAIKSIFLFRKDLAVNFTEEELINDYKRMLAIYDEIYQNMDTDSYNEIIDRIITFTKTQKSILF